MEMAINAIFSGRNLKANPLTDRELEAIITWLELIDYKFHERNHEAIFRSKKMIQ
jgi:hypothetical protein